MRERLGIAPGFATNTVLDHVNVMPNLGCQCSVCARMGQAGPQRPGHAGGFAFIVMLARGGATPKCCNGRLRFCGVKLFDLLLVAPIQLALHQLNQGCASTTRLHHHRMNFVVAHDARGFVMFDHQATKRINRKANAND